MKPSKIALKIDFTDNFLINFTGTQEELDSIVRQLTEKYEKGELFGDFDPEEPFLTVGDSLDEIMEQGPRIFH
jgi:hypothetical protein